MRYPETFAVHFARLLEYVMGGRSKDDQKAEFRSILGLLGDDSVLLEDAGDHVLINGGSVTFPAVGRLLEALRAQRVRRIRIETGAHPAHIFNLVQALAGRVDGQPRDHLERTGSTSVSIELGDPPTAEQAVAAEGIDNAPADPLTELPLAETALPKVREAIEQLLRDPNRGEASSLLQMLLLEVESAVKDGWAAQALVAAQAVLRIEKRIERDDVRIAHMKAQRVILSPQLLEAFARTATDPQLRPTIVEIFRTAGSRGTDYLVELLEKGETKTERLAYIHVLAQLREGMDRVLTMLSHPQWYVVRNGAELCGELRLSHAVSSLARALDHRDQRVRRAAAYAFGRIGTLEAAEHFRRAIRDREPEVRRHALAGLQGSSASPMVALIATLLERDSSIDVRREVLYALGRIGTSDAAELLATAAAPGGKLFGRKKVVLRVAATEALGLVRGGGSEAALAKLATDDVPEVQAAAKRALRGDIRDNSWEPNDQSAPRLSSTNLRLSAIQ